MSTRAASSQWSGGIGLALATRTFAKLSHWPSERFELASTATISSPAVLPDALPVCAFIKSGGQSESEPIEGRIADVINYCLLLWHMIETKRRDKVK